MQISLEVVVRLLKSLPVKDKGLDNMAPDYGSGVEASVTICDWMAHRICIPDGARQSRLSEDTQGVDCDYTKML